MATDNRIKIGNSLKRFRKAFNLTQDNVADAIGIFRPLYTKYEGDKNMPSVDTVMKIAVAFNVSMDYLVGLSDEPRPVPADKAMIEKIASCRDSIQELLSMVDKATASVTTQ